MRTELSDYIRQALCDNRSAVIRLSEIEKLGGEDWLLEVSAQAQQLKAQAMPHPHDSSLIIVELDKD